MLFSAGLELETMDWTMSFSSSVLVNYVIAPPDVIGKHQKLKKHNFGTPPPPPIKKNQKPQP